MQYVCFLNSTIIACYRKFFAFILSQDGHSKRIEKPTKSHALLLKSKKEKIAKRMQKDDTFETGDNFTQIHLIF